jgi:hypothetical protein
MTCIVGLVDNGNIIMGSDSLISTNGWEVSLLAQPKIFRLGEMLIGVAGKLRLLQLVEHELKLPDIGNGESPMHYMISGFVPALMQLLEKAGFIEIESGTKRMDGNLIIGFRGHLFTIAIDFAVQEDLHGYDVIGGCSHALGSLYTSERAVGMTPKGRVMMALSAAECFDASIREPFHILELITK